MKNCLAVLLQLLAANAIYAQQGNAANHTLFIGTSTQTGKISGITIIYSPMIINLGC